MVVAITNCSTYYLVCEVVVAVSFVFSSLRPLLLLLMLSSSLGAGSLLKEEDPPTTVL